jgi:Zn-dependent protease with chaperone function
MYQLLGICLALTGLLALNAAASLGMAAIWKLSRRRFTGLSARARAEILFGMRALPPAIALLCVGFFLIPAYITHEPLGTDEVVSKKLAVLAFLSAAGLALAGWRIFGSWRATRILLRSWLASAVPIELNGIDVPAFRFRHPFPIIAVVGTLKPRLFIAEHVLSELKPEELAAAIAHEHGHLAARDNFKRSTLRVCRNALFIVPFGRSLDRAWADAAEAAADEHAASINSDSALNLASALVKIAKMVPAGARASVPLAAYLVGAEETQGVKTRIRRLIEIASAGFSTPAPSTSLTRIIPFSLLGATILCATILASNPKVLLTVHVLIEHTVDLLC